VRKKFLKQYLVQFCHCKGYGCVVMFCISWGEKATNCVVLSIYYDCVHSECTVHVREVFTQVQWIILCWKHVQQTFSFIAVVCKTWGFHCAQIRVLAVSSSKFCRTFGDRVGCETLNFDPVTMLLITRVLFVQNHSRHATQFSVCTTLTFEQPVVGTEQWSFNFICRFSFSFYILIRPLHPEKFVCVLTL
jgi:hypothetical protein